MADKITIDDQTEQDAAATLPAVNDVPAETAPSRTVRFADRETVRRAGKEIFRRHARLFRELAK